MIWRGPDVRSAARAAHLWRLGKTAIWLKKDGCAGFFVTSAVIGAIRPQTQENAMCLRRQELKPRKRYDLEGSTCPVWGKGSAPLALK